MIYFSSQDSAIFRDLGVDFWLTDRFGGVSKPPFESLNLGINTQDSRVFDNHAILKAHLNAKKFFYLNQIHGDDIVVLGESSGANLGENLDENTPNLGGKNQHLGCQNLGCADGILCAKRGVFAMICVADCHPVLLFARDLGVFALLHAGRKGLEKRIITKAAKMLDSREIAAFVGVGIKKCCYEISGDLLETYAATAPQFLCESGGKIHLDMAAMIELELESCGIREVEMMSECSCCDERFFSYRRSGGVCGRFALVARLRTF